MKGLINSLYYINYLTAKAVLNYIFFEPGYAADFHLVMAEENQDQFAFSFFQLHLQMLSHSLHSPTSASTREKDANYLIEKFGICLHKVRFVMVLLEKNFFGQRIGSEID